MKKNLLKIAIALIPFTLTAQENEVKTTSYFAPYVGVNFQGKLNAEQTGTAHKRGNYNAFGTDFDLNVKVEGESKSAVGATFGFTYGNRWTKQDRKWNPGIEIDLFHTVGKHESELSNPENEEVSNMVGPNQDKVIELVDEHYGKGHHNFANSMTMTSWNTAGNFTLSYTINEKVSFNTALGVGFSAITLLDAESLQTSPAEAVPGYETTKDNGGGAVNHYNTKTVAYNNVLFGQLRFGTKIQFTPKIAWSLDARGTYRGATEFTFGSTKYTDHAPTDNWNYSIEKAIGVMLTTGLAITF
jgi:hypothetical protein